MIGVWDAAGALAAAVADLPLSVRPSDGPAGSIAVVTGGDWRADLRAAVVAGAVAVVVVEPSSSGDEPAPTVPVVVVRRRLTRDLAPGVQSWAFVAECSATEGTLESALRDTIGWVRELSGGDLRLRARAGGSGGELALVETAGGAPVSLTVQEISGVPDGAVIRVTTLGVVRRQVVVDDVAMLFELTTAVDGSTSLTTGRFESPERLALRRMLVALAAADRPADLAELAHDDALARSILGGPE